MKRRLPMYLSLVLCLSGGGMSAKTARIATGKGDLMFVSGDYTLSVSEETAWTIRDFTYRGTPIMNGRPGAFNGAVLKMHVEESGRVDWVGTGHGHEVVESVRLRVDGQEKPLTPGAVYTGTRLTFEKISSLRALNLRATTTLSPEGLEETHQFTVRHEPPELTLLYGFMHCFDHGLTEWYVAGPDGAHRQDRFAGDNGRPFDGELDWTALYTAEAGRGVVYMPVRPHPKAAHFFWDREADNKLYLRAQPDFNALKRGEIFAYTVRLRGFTAVPENWTETARTTVEDIRAKHKTVQDAPEGGGIGNKNEGGPSWIENE